MDEQTFRRLAPDAVAGRLDTATYERWKTAAADDPARATFVVRVAEADARLSARHWAPASAAEPAKRIPRRTFLSLGALIAVLGLLAGALVMNSYLKVNKPPADTNALLADAPANLPANTQAPERPPANQPPTNRAPIVPDPPVKPDPQPMPDPPQPAPAMRLVWAGGKVSVRGERDSEWRRMQVGDAIPAEAMVAGDAGARFSEAGIEVYAAGALQFERTAGSIRFMTGRACVRVSAPQKFTCYKQQWSMARGAFIVEPRKLGGELYLLEGAIEQPALNAPQHLLLDGTTTSTTIDANQLAALEIELLGPHRKLLSWDCESQAASPTIGEIVKPGALGTGHAVRRVSGQAGIGVTPSTEVFTAEAGARLRLRVKTTASALRIEFRVGLDAGYRLVDARIDVRGNDDWQTIDVPMSVLRAGRFRAEPGWLTGRVYSAFLLAPAVNPNAPLARHELLIDDLLVYLPES